MRKLYATVIFILIPFVLNADNVFSIKDKDNKSYEIYFDVNGFIEKINDPYHSDYHYKSGYLEDGSFYFTYGKDGQDKKQTAVFRISNDKLVMEKDGYIYQIENIRNNGFDSWFYKLTGLDYDDFKILSMDSQGKYYLKYVFSESYITEYTFDFENYRYFLDIKVGNYIIKQYCNDGETWYYVDTSSIYTNKLYNKNMIKNIINFYVLSYCNEYLLGYILPFLFLPDNEIKEGIIRNKNYNHK